ncbi:MAG: CbtA family protein [Acetobacteraceae bacterium]
MDQFRHLIVRALMAGSLAGLVLFAVQHVTIVPLIDQAEVLEAAAGHAPAAAVHAHAGTGHDHSHGDEGWQPAPGWQRIGLTALTTVISSIGFAAILLAVVTLAGARMDIRRGILWGIAGFACFVLAPAIGLPPKPPGAAVGDLHLRQLWWLGTVIATALGLWLALGPSRGWIQRVLGIIVLALPHLVGAPQPDGPDAVPAALMRDFAMLSVATNLLFWIVLGCLCGLSADRQVRQRDVLPV